MAEVDSSDTEVEMGPDNGHIKLWLEEIKQAKKDNEAYWKKCDSIAAKYKGEESGQVANLPSAPRKYNVLWSVIQTMQPLVYSKPPRPYVARRFSDADPAARDASQILQRGLQFGLEGNELHDALLDARDDYLLASRGVIWPKYSPYMQLRLSIEKVEVDDPSSVPPEYEAVQAEDGSWYYEAKYEEEEKIYEECDWEHVHYKDFLHGASAKWKHVPWIARRVPMTRKMLNKRFGKEVGKRVPLTINGKNKRGMSSDAETSDEGKGLFAKAEVWEIWDKSELKIYWLCPDFTEGFLDEQDDFLELDGFFPCPRPAYGTKTNDSLMPTPDYCMWQDIAIELDEVTHRIKLLTEAMRVVGVYDQSLGDKIKRITTQTADNDLIGIDNWMQFAEKGGLAAAIEFLPIENVAAVLERLHQARQRLTQELYEITGISDIIRGASDPRETASAQKVKGQYANKRLNTREGEIIRMVDEALEIQSQIMSKHYSDSTLRMISSAEQVLLDPMGQQFDQNRFSAAVELLRSGLRQYRIKVDEKSLVEEDNASDQEQRNVIVQTISGLLSSSAQMMEQSPQAAPLLGQLMMFAVRGFPLAQSEESALQDVIDKSVQQAMQPPEEPQPDPIDMQKLQIEQQKLQIEQQRLQLEMKRIELEQQKIMGDLELRKAEAQMQNQNRQVESQLRDRKQAQEGMLRYEQLQTQERTQQAAASAATEQKREANAVAMNKWIGDSDIRERELDDKKRIELAKIFASGTERQADAAQRAEADKKKHQNEKTKMLIDAFKGFSDGNESGS